MIGGGGNNLQRTEAVTSPNGHILFLSRDIEFLIMS